MGQRQHRHAWNVQSVGTAGSNADTTNTIHESIEGGIRQVLVYSAVQLYFNFSSSNSGTDGDVNTSNDLIVEKNTLTALNVPTGIAQPGRAIYFNYLSTSTTTGAVRIVEC